MKMNNGIDLCGIFQGVGVEVSPLKSFFGLRIVLSERRNLAPIFAEKSADLCDLAARHGVVVVENAVVQEPSGRILRLSGAGEPDRPLAQDFWHWDSVASGMDPLANAIFRPEPGTGRAAPTLYARIADVRAALKKLSLADIPPNLHSAIRRIKGQGHTFGIEPADRLTRNDINKYAPDLTALVAALIPEDRIYAHPWRAGAEDVVIHAIDPKGDLLHARPASVERGNPLQGFLLRP